MRSQKVFAALIFIFSIFSSSLLVAAPIMGKEYKLRQPDGSKVTVKMWGDEFYQRVESLDGYTLARNAEGWICYADVCNNGEELVATDRIYTGAQQQGDLIVKTKLSKQDRKVEKGLKLSRSAILKKHKESRDAFNFDQVLAVSGTEPAEGISAAAGTQMAPPLGTDPLLGSVVGLTICINFPDEAGTITRQQVDDYCNMVGYNGFGNNGSVRDYYYDISGGNLTYTNIVEGYYTAKNNKSYYDDPERGAGDAGRELLAEALDWLNTQQFDFRQLSIDSSNTMLAINLFYAGQVESGWAMGLWPHSGYYGDFTSTSGVHSGRYQITDMGTALTIGTFCHENGHMICHWPDLYDYDYDSEGVGMFCLMAAGSYGGPNMNGTNPVPANAYFRDIKGWENVVEMTPATGPIYTHQANTASSFRYSNPGQATEFFYIESRLQTGRSAYLPDQGFIIWHVDELGDNDNQQMTPTDHYLVSMEQADGLFQMETNINYGDGTDCFGPDTTLKFNDTTLPSAKWWNGTLSGLDFTMTSPIGAAMTFETADLTPPIPSPMTWKTSPRALGLRTIYMEATAAQDAAGVEYFFDCLTNDAFDKWQDSPIYYRGDYTPGTAYQFQVSARDKSPLQNQGQPSVMAETMTAAGTDTLVPHPDPAQWKSKPRAISTTRASMEAALGYDEFNTVVEYRFECTYTNDTNVNISTLGRDWSTDPRHTVSGLTVASPGHIYRFRVQMRDVVGNETQWSEEADAIFAPKPVIREVPSTQYGTIQAAIDAANHGDTVRVHPGIYMESNIDLRGKRIVVRSENPEDPAVVAATIINCGGNAASFDHTSRRAFLFQNGEGRDTVVSGFTIADAYAVNGPQTPNEVPAADAPADGANAFGGAILCGVLGSDSFTLAAAQTPASPTIQHCVFSNCNARGQYGGVYNGQDTLEPGAPGEDGGTGGNGGWGKGGAIYAVSGSNPLIQYCQFENCAAVGGNGSDGGSGGQGGSEDTEADPEVPAGVGGNGGMGGNGASAYGGAFYFENGCQPVIKETEIRNSFAELGQPGAGGAPGVGGTNDQDEVIGDEGLEGGNGGLSNTETYANGVDFGAGAGAIYFGSNSKPQIETVAITNCRTIAAITGPIDGANTGMQRCYGGAIYWGPSCENVIVGTDPVPFLGLEITGCQTDRDHGGAMAFDASCLMLFEGCTFESNTSTDGADGGAVYLQDPRSITFFDTEFSSNSGVQGGAIYFNALTGGASLTLRKCTLDGNIAVFDNKFSWGGALYAGNVAAANDLLAGVISLPPYNVTISEGTTFSKNASLFGGAVCTDAVNLMVTDSQIESNSAEIGAGLYLNVSDVQIHSTTFVDNSAEPNVVGSLNMNCSGGGLYSLNSFLKVKNSVFRMNTAQGTGGAAVVIGPSPDASMQLFTNCLLLGNTAGLEGGAITAFVSSEVGITNCTLYGNTVLDTTLGAGGAVLCYDAFVDIRSSILWDNLSVYGPQIAAGELDEYPSSYNPYSTVFVDNSCVQGGEASLHMADEWAWISYNQATNTQLDPQFISVPRSNSLDTRTFYLSQISAGQRVDSPCLDTGYGDAAALSTEVGIEQLTTRTDHTADTGMVDMGYHYNASLPTRNYLLQTSVIIPDREPHGTILPEPLVIHSYMQGTVVELTATPDNSNYRVRRWIGTDNDLSTESTNYVTMNQNCSVQVEFELAVPSKLYVPETYDTIEDALAAARSGDTIVLGPRPDQPYLITNADGIRFGLDAQGNPKNLVITSADPNDSLTVASTIIDCQGSRYQSKRAFHFAEGQTNESQILGITIRNAFTAEIGLSGAVPLGRWPWWTGPDPQAWTVNPANPSPLPPMRALSGSDAIGDNYGGAVLCENNSSPVFYNCVFENCTVAGGIGGDGDDGQYPANLETPDDLDSQSGGHSGFGSGNGYGGAIALRTGSSPRIENCEFKGNRATGGWGGIPGNAGRSYNNGRYGWGGNDPAGLQYAAIYFDYNYQAGCGEGDGQGGAIYIEASCKPTILACKFEGNYARPGYVSVGGSQGSGNEYPDPFDGDTVGAMGLPWGQNDARIGRDGYLLTYETIAGGALYIEDSATITLQGCSFVQNQAYEVFGPEDPAVSMRGGAVYSDPDVVLTINETEFRENAAGAIYCSTGNFLQIDNSQFINNNSTILPDDAASHFNLAGGITVEVDADANSINCEFIGNRSNVGGGAIRTDSDMDLVNCILNGNLSLNDGGAIYSFVSLPSPQTHTVKLTLDNCELSGNEAQGYGGAMFVKTCELWMTKSFLVSNKAFSGGALRVSHSDFKNMDGCLVFDNHATGVVTGSHRSVTAEGFGGGLHITDSPFTIQNTRFENNTAAGIISSGGALCITGSQTYYSQLVKNCLFANNESDALGGAVSAVLWVQTGFENCTFARNKAERGSALYLDQLSDITFKRSIVSGNLGTAIYEKAGGNSAATYSLFYANEGGDVFDGTTTQTYSQLGTILVSNPQFATGPLGDFYLTQSGNPAVDPFNDSSKYPYYPTAAAVGLDTFMTDPMNPGGMPDGSATNVDLGYHYDNSAQIQHFPLTVAFQDDQGMPRTDVGTVTPMSGNYARGSTVTVTAAIKGEYFLTGWLGGTLNDNSLEPTNKVLMTRPKDVYVLVRMRETLYVGGSSRYDTLGDAIFDAKDGDIILVAPGEYTSPSQFPTIANSVILTGKKVTISGFAPSDDTVVRSTVFRDYRFELLNLDNQTVIEGVTFNQCWTYLENADIIIRNCVYRECQFSNPTERHTGNVPAGTDGYHQFPNYGGAIAMFDSSPRVINCVFEDNWTRGADGENGFAGAQSHATGGDGGWPGAAYGGAVYCGFSSEPEFEHCTFTGNQVFGGNGGNGANGWVDRGVTYNGGRGGGWAYDPAVEELLKTYGNGGWDGWANNSYGDKYSAWSLYSYFFGQYDLVRWAKWFNWTDSYTSWEQFEADYLADPYDPLGDAYDQLLDPWMYGGFGGAVYCAFDSKGTFKDCVFESNQSHAGLTGIGGVIYNGTPWPDRQLNMPNAGGAVYALWDSELTFTNCVFQGNTADVTTVDLPHSFNVSFGGAVAYENDCTVTFDNCDMFDNQATVGGGLYGYDAVSTVTDCNIFGNEAYLGAGAYLEHETAAITKTTFQSNIAKIRDGDPAPVDPEATPELKGMGGGLFAHVIDLSIRDSIFAENTSLISGGGLLLSGTVDEPTDIFNCLFVQNTAYRDGGGASVNWMSRVDFRSCTFADNTAESVAGDFGSGGGLYLATDTIAEVIDSIFWDNTAVEGLQITVGSGDQFDPRPSSLTISYSDIGTYPSANAIFVGAGCTIDNRGGIIAESPMFARPAGAEIVFRYYLNQQTSPCKDAGSRSAFDAGLSGYTTSVNGARDKGIVDLGFHYFISPRAQCGDIDEALVLSGQVDLEDWEEIANWWLSPETTGCGENNQWCDGADVNYDGSVDIDDMLMFMSCYLTADTEAPYPTPTWVVEPNATIDTFDAIDMTASVVHDAWWPDSKIQYRFDCVQPEDDAYDSGWINSSSWAISGLSPQTYAYRVQARDGSKLETEWSETRSVTPGASFDLPAPEWEIPPYVTANNQVHMKLRAYAGTLPAGYAMKYSFAVAGGTAGRDYMPNSAWTDPAQGYLAGVTYEYTGKMQLYYLDPVNGDRAIGAATLVTAQVVFVPGDLYAPLPDPAQHTASSPYQISIGIQWYHVVTAVQAVDVDAAGEEGEANANVEYKFVCVNEPGYSSGGSYDETGIQWRNVDNVAGLLYPNATAQIPEQYWVRVGLKNRLYNWYIIVRDRSVARNATDPSESKPVLAVP